MTWLGFAAPLWLAGLAALAMPAVIHLLSRGRQRRLPIGSVRWLVAAETVRARRLRPSRWWLLLLRLLLLGAVVLALAGPRFGLARGSAPADWLLIDPEAVAQRARLEGDNRRSFEVLDKLAGTEAQVRWLAPGLPRAELENPPAPGAASLWSLLVEADRAAPSGARWTVITTARIARLGGARPVLERQIDWHAVVDRRENRWLARTLAGDGDQADLVVGFGDHTRTRYQRRVVGAGDAAGDQQLARVERSAAGDGLAIDLLDGGGVDSDDRVVIKKGGSPVAVAILHSAERELDAQAVRAALEAAARLAGRELRVRQAASSGTLASGERVDLLFWLAAEPVPGPLLAAVDAGALLVSDALERFETCGVVFRPAASARLLRVERCGATDAGAARQASVPLWVSSSGSPLLFGERSGEGLWLRFASRFDPQWTEWVLAPEFPRWLLSLVERVAPRAASAGGRTSDRRAAGEMARPAATSPKAPPARRREVPLEAGLWLQVLLLAAVERWWALRGGR